MNIHSFKLIVDDDQLKHKYASPVEIEVLYSEGFSKPEIVHVFDIKISPIVAASVKNWISFNRFIQSAAENNYSSMTSEVSA